MDAMDGMDTNCGRRHDESGLIRVHTVHFRSFFASKGERLFVRAFRSGELLESAEGGAQPLEHLARPVLRGYSGLRYRLCLLYLAGSVSIQRCKIWQP